MEVTLIDTFFQTIRFPESIQRKIENKDAYSKSIPTEHS